MSSGIVLPDEVKTSLLTASYVDDFFGLDESKWTTIGTATHDADGDNGVVQLITAATDNDESYLSTKAVFDFTQGKNYLVVARIKYAEANVDDANVMFGLMQSVAGNAMLDDGAGPKADYDGAVFFKVDGGSRWQFESSEGTNQTTTDLDYTAGGGVYQTLAIQVFAKSSSQLEITPWIDPQGGNNLKQAREFGANPRVPLVRHDRTLAAATGKMSVVFGMKAGAANAETLDVDLCTFALDR